jgi:hypothetical protein
MARAQWLIRLDKELRAHRRFMCKGPTPTENWYYNVVTRHFERVQINGTVLGEMDIALAAQYVWGAVGNTARFLRSCGVAS